MGSVAFDVAVIEFIHYFNLNFMNRANLVWWTLKGTDVETQIWRRDFRPFVHVLLWSTLNIQTTQIKCFINVFSSSRTAALLYSFWISCRREMFQAGKAHPTLSEAPICWFTTGARILTWTNGWKTQLRYEGRPLPLICPGCVFSLSLSNSTLSSLQEERQHRQEESIGDNLFR